MNVCVIDFETFFDQDYTLKKMPMSQYVRDKRFYVHGFAYKWNNEKTEWVDGCDARRVLKEQDWGDITVVCHNALFDGFILTQHYKVHPRRYVCTMAMARALHLPNNRVSLDVVAQLYGMKPKPVDADEWKGRTEFTQREWNRIILRATGDVIRTHKIYKRMLPRFPEDEMDLIDITAKMFTEPKLVLDAPLVEKVGRAHERQRRALLKKALPELKFLDALDLLRSDQQFFEYLSALPCPTDALLTPPTKWSVKQDKFVPAFAANDQEFQSWQLNPDLKPYYEARVNAKSSQTESKVTRLLAQRPPYRVAVDLNYCGAHTLRFSGGGDKSNFQNMERGSDIRRSLRAPKRYRIAVLDAAQIEARLNAWTAGQDDLLHQFATGVDPYKEQAADVYHVPIEEVTPEQRFVGKTLILAAGYQMGAEKFQMRMATDKHNPVYLELSEAGQAINAYRRTNRQIVRQWRVLQGCINDMYFGREREYRGLIFSKNKVLMPNGLYLRYPDLQSVHGDFTYAGLNARRKIYGGLLTENIMQCLARIILTEHMLKIARMYRIVLTVHDEIVFLIPEKNADKHYAKALNIACQSPSWAPDLPVKAEGGHAALYFK